ncbi:MAG: tetratricopeptide repeat protein [Bacteroidetes bacterium]|nr:tetratricopeptide repeat protein [Bacteroidota bacterium]
MTKNIFYFLSLLPLLASCSVSKKSSIPSTPKSTSVKDSKRAKEQDMALFLDAERARLMGNFQEALKLYTEYIGKNAGNATAFYNVSRIYYHNKEINLAIKYAEKATQLDPGNKYFQEFYIQMLVYNNNTQKAESQFNTLIEKNPSNEDFIYKKAMLHVKAKDYEKALVAFSDLEKKIGFNEDIILQKKALYQRLGKTDLAIAELQKLREAEPAAVQYLIMMIDVYEDVKQKQKTEDMYQELETKFPDDPLAQVALAQYYLDKNNTPQYNSFMQKVIKNKNLDVDTKIALIIPSLQKLESDSTSDKNQILEMAKTITTESPDNKGAQQLYADILYYSKKNDEALIEYKKFLKLDQSKFDPWSQIMSIYLDKQLHDSVIQYGTQCVDLFPNNPMPYFFMGISYLQKKEASKAVKPLSKAVDLEPENPALYAQLYASLGEAYHSLKNFEWSDSCFEKSLKIQPNDATTLNNYAYYLSLRKSKLDEAEKMSKKSLVLQPDSKSFLDTYGWILFQQGKYAEAKTYIEKAIKAGGEEDGTLFEHLGDIYYKLNDVAKAKEHWNLAKSKGEDNPLLNKKAKEGMWYEE